MIILQSILEALESLSSNKLRSGLTIIGIVIGVAAVIAIVSIGRGAENTITGSIQGIGTNLLFVFSGGSEDVRNPKPLTLGDADAMADPFQAPSVAAGGACVAGQRGSLRRRRNDHHPGERCDTGVRPGAQPEGHRR